MIAFLYPVAKVSGMVRATGDMSFLALERDFESVEFEDSEECSLQILA